MSEQGERGTNRHPTPATCRGLVGLAKYLLRQCDLEYVLLGKIQSDRLEGHFGHLRKLAGGNFWASSRQFFEGEAIVRVKSLIWLSGYGLSTVTAGMHPVSQQRMENDQRAVTEITEHAVAASSDEPAQDVPGESRGPNRCLCPCWPLGIVTNTYVWEPKLSLLNLIDGEK